MSFQAWGLSAPLLQNLAQLNYRTPTAIQQRAIPVVLKGKDLLAAAQTGTGKTAAFALPMLELLLKGQPVASNQVRALILTPTRELAVQVEAQIKSYAQSLPLRTAVVYGGVKINPQMMAMRRGVDILVATPGRLLDLAAKNAIRFNQLEILVLDEADRMLDLGFRDELQQLLPQLPKRRQTLLFSATFSDPIRTLARQLLNQPVEIQVTPPNSTNRQVRHWLCPVDKRQKADLFLALLEQHRWSQVLAFCKTRQDTDRLVKRLQAQGVHSDALHGDRSQASRQQALDAFKAGKLSVLIATDVAARGIDIDQLPVVINIDLPIVAENYVHRIGRTGRAGHRGLAISLVCADEFKHLQAIEQLLNRELPREYFPGFEPQHEVPASRRDAKPKKIKKPKKAKTTGEAAATAPRSSAAKKPPRQRSASDRTTPPRNPASPRSKQGRSKPIRQT